MLVRFEGDPNLRAPPATPGIMRSRATGKAANRPKRLSAVPEAEYGLEPITRRVHGSLALRESLSRVSEDSILSLLFKSVWLAACFDIFNLSPIFINLVILISVSRQSTPQ